MSIPVFVYGTLRRGGSNAHRLGGDRFLGRATTSGHLFRVDWYPALVLDPLGGRVTGELHRTDDDQLVHLDEYEGPEYVRRLHLVQPDDGPPVTAWIWEWIRPTTGLARIPSGDWFDVRPDTESPSPPPLNTAPHEHPAGPEIHPR